MLNDYTLSETGPLASGGRLSRVSSPPVHRSPSITLPMADLLAEATLPSPWDGLSGQPDFDQLLARAIDDLIPLERVMSCKQITDATPRKGMFWRPSPTTGGPRGRHTKDYPTDAAMSLDSMGQILRALKRKGVVRETTLHLRGGRRLRFLTISGQHLMDGYRRRYLASAHDESSSAQLGAHDESNGDRLISTPITLVVSSSSKSNDFEQLTNVPGDESSTLVDVASSAPPWWDRFAAHVGRISRPTPRPPNWPELASLLDAGRDPEAQVLLEACAQFLDVYSQPRHSAVRSLRAVVRKIYQELLGHGGLTFYATGTWFSVEPDPQDEPPSGRDYGPFPAECAVAADPAAAALWREVLDDLRLQLPRPAFETRLKDTQGVLLQGNVFVVEAAGTFAVEWLERRMHHTMERTLERVAGRPLELRLRVRTQEV